MLTEAMPWAKDGDSLRHISGAEDFNAFMNGIFADDYVGTTYDLSVTTDAETLPVVRTRGGGATNAIIARAVDPFPLSFPPALPSLNPVVAVPLLPSPQAQQPWAGALLNGVGRATPIDWNKDGPRLGNNSGNYSIVNVEQGKEEVSSRAGAMAGTLCTDTGAACMNVGEAWCSKLSSCLPRTCLPSSCLPGKKYRLRILCAASEWGYRVTIDNHTMPIISVLGNDIEPYNAPEFGVRAR